MEACGTRYRSGDSRRLVKKTAKHFVKNAYWMNVLISVIGAFVAGSLGQGLLSLLSDNAVASTENWKYLKELLASFGVIIEPAAGTIWQLVDELGGALFDMATSVFNLAFYIMHQCFVEYSALAIFLLVIALVIICAFIFFVKYPVKVGTRRYYVEKRMVSGDPDLKDLLHVYRRKNAIHASFILLLKDIYLLLWSLTIVGGVIKTYEYKMVEYILTENPSIGVRECFALSKRMTKGHKFDLFMLDLSFLGWDILNLFTLNVLSVFYLYSYKDMTAADVYVELRNEAVRKDSCLTALLLERDLDAPILVDIPRKREFRIDYNVRYSVADLVLIFFTVCVVGWLWEVVFNIIKTQHFVNRGTMYGPWLPIYGSGALVALILLRGMRKYPWATFFTSMIVCSVIEYVTSWVIEKATGLVYWDYSDKPFNINGRVYLYGALFFGAGCVGIIYVVAPVLKKLYAKIPKKAVMPICCVLIAVFVTDAVISLLYPHTVSGWKPSHESAAWLSEVFSYVRFCVFSTGKFFLRV